MASKTNHDNGKSWRFLFVTKVSSAEEPSVLAWGGFGGGANRKFGQLAKNFDRRNRMLFL